MIFTILGLQNYIKSSNYQAQILFQKCVSVVWMQHVAFRWELSALAFSMLSEVLFVCNFHIISG